MKLSEDLNMQGALTIKILDKDKKKISESKTKNNIVLSGRDLVSKLFINEEIATVSHIAVGTGSRAVDVDDKELEKELFRKELNKIDTTSDLVKTTDNRMRVTLTAELEFNKAIGALSEAGLFNKSTGGVMYNRVVFDKVNKTEEFTLTLIWEILF